VKQNIKRIIAVLLLCVLLLSNGLIFASASDEATYKAELKNAGFPDAYLDKLWQMHQKHPNWKFVPYATGLDWDTAVAKQNEGKKNLVYISTGAYCATRLYRSHSVGTYTPSNGFDFTYERYDGGWVKASPMAIAFFMNPYNFIGNEITLMMFEQLSWPFGEDMVKAITTVEVMLNGTFMSKTRNSKNNNYVDGNGNITYRNASGGTETITKTYAEVICTAAKKYNVNPCYLVSKIIGEVGSGGSGSTTGTHGTYPGYYNYFNIGASDSQEGLAVTKGLKHAQSKGWDTPEKSIDGGTEFIARSYISVGQDTAFLQKFNLTPRSTYGHQYMTAVNGVVNTTYSTYDGYRSAGTLDIERTFKIPVLNNMPNATATSVNFTGYFGLGEGIVTVPSSPDFRNKALENDRGMPKIMPNASLDGDSIGTVANGSSITVYGGFREIKVAYDEKFKRDSTYYRMHNPLWYSVKVGGTNGYVCEDFVDVTTNNSVPIGSSFKLTYKLSSGSTEVPRFMSHDTRIATVNTNGVVTGVSAGTTEIVIYTANGAFDVLKLTVVAVNENGVPVIATSPKYAVNNGSSFISRVSQNTTVGTFKNSINERQYLRITKDGKTLTDDAILSTGCEVSIMDGDTVVKKYTVIITGDVNGDGKINITDLLAVRDHSLSGGKMLNVIQAKAGDVADNNKTRSDGKANITDVLAIRDHIAGKSTIVPVAY